MEHLGSRQDPHDEAIGVVGVGLVGLALAEHLITRGFHVVGFDIEPARCAELERLGGQVASGPSEVGARTRRIFLSLMTTETVSDVIEGDDGLMTADRAPRYLLDTTTGMPDETVALAERLRKRGVSYLDATISGSSQQIRDRQAVVMVGGDAADYEACGDLLRAVSDRVVHLGLTGSGSKAKLASNLILGLNRLALAEGLVFADRLGLDGAAFLDLLKISPAYSVAVDVKGEKMLRGDFTAQSRAAQHHKDLSIILDQARRAGQDLPLARVHLGILEKVIAKGDGELDSSVVIEEIRRRQSASVTV